jgi:hypothetical protein
LAADEPGRVKLVDGSRSEEMVEKDVLSAVLAVLKKAP